MIPSQVERAKYTEFIRFVYVQSQRYIYIMSWVCAYAWGSTFVIMEDTYLFIFYILVNPLDMVMRGQIKRVILVDFFSHECMSLKYHVYR